MIPPKITKSHSPESPLTPRITAYMARFCVLLRKRAIDTHRVLDEPPHSVAVGQSPKGMTQNRAGSRLLLRHYHEIAC